MSSDCGVSGPKELGHPLDPPRSLGLGLYVSDAACGWRRRQALTRSVTGQSRGEAPPVWCPRMAIAAPSFVPAGMRTSQRFTGDTPKE
ncbi:hypothetical protein GOODEAATRI_007048 [Goodea atripinnis]|uniref:Uncharacterized protein n=1 Tax=Goodea atripinnis TaxID=208336 RepID=A0ABV0NBS7_9TELE